MTEDRRGPLERYLSILEIVAASQRSLTLTELSQLMRLPKPTIHRLVGVLQSTGALKAESGGQKTFSIGPRIWRILQLGQDESVVANFAQIVCNDLAREVKETCYIVKLGQDSVHTVARAVPDQGYRLHVLPGEDLPAHAASSAKAILAYQTEDVADRLLSLPLLKMTEYTLTDINEVKSNLKRISKQGYAVCDREIDPNIMAYSCPVFLPEAGVLYSVGVTGPCNRLRPQTADYWVAALQAAAKQFAAMLTTIKQ